MNLNLLCKWWWKLESEDGLWQTIIRAKYMRGGSLIGAIKHKLDDSPVWSDLLKVRHIYMANRGVKVNNGKTTLFWEDLWLKDKPLCLLYPVIYDLCSDKHISIHYFLSNNAQLHFSRWLPHVLFSSWLNLITEVYCYSFNNSRDTVIWKGNKSASFSSKSVYDSLTKTDHG